MASHKQLQKKLFVWDFHGVLEKDNELAVLEISNQVLEQAGYKERFSEEDNRRYYGLKWYEYFECLLPELSHEEHVALQQACFDYAYHNLHILEKYLKPNDYAVDVLAAIRAMGHDQIVLSNTRPSDLLWFIQAVHIKEYFRPEAIIGVNAHERHGDKQAALRHYLQVYGPFRNVLIIGDSESDMQLKAVTGGVAYFYTHPHVAPPQNTSADHVINDLRMLLREL